MAKVKSIAASAVLLLAVTGTATAAEFVVNGGFESTLNPSGTGKDAFFNHVAGWTGGGNLTFVSTPGAIGLVDPIYGFAVAGSISASPNGGNLVFADGDVGFNLGFSQTINNLLVGSVYTLTFYQASGQQLFPGGAGALTTQSQWQVEFGSDTVMSTMMTTPPQTITPWQLQTFTFTATSSTQVLRFLAVGGPAGAPPVSFIDGISLDGKVPEPATLGLLGVGLMALGIARRRNRKAA